MEFLKIAKLFAQDFYAVPDYQRDYEWTNAQNATLIDDVFAIIRDQGSTNHFLGAIVTIPYEESNSVNKSIDFDSYSIDKGNIKHVVDGQQRLTSFSVLIKVVYDLLDAEQSVDGSFKNNYKDMLKGLFRGNAYDANGNAAPRIVLNGNTGFCYNNKILGLTNQNYQGKYKGARRLMAAYTLFKNEIQSQKRELIEDHIFANDQMFYKFLVETLMNKIVFVEIECDASSDAFQVFDSLNGKGLDLTAADRIKNVMMSWSPRGKGAQKWEALVQQTGEDYLASFFVSLFFYNCGKRVSKNKLPEEFKSKYRLSAQNDYEYFYQDLKESGTLYGNLRACRTGIAKLDAVLKDFQSLQMDQVYVMLFAAAKNYGNDRISSNDFLAFSKALLSLIVRMQVCEKSMNKLDGIFSECIDMMKTQSASLVVLTNKINDKKKDIVPDDIFEADFSRFSPTETSIELFYLKHIEEYLRLKTGSRTTVDEFDLTVEHVIPQTLDDLSDWYGETPIPDDIRENFQENTVESIGNKALLYGPENSSASNNTYDKKLYLYQNGIQGQNRGTPVGTFEIIKDLVEKYPRSFTHVEVIERAKNLAKIAVDIW